MKNIAVFGGSGFLGSYIVNELILRGYNVKSIDIKNSEYVSNENFLNASILDSDLINKIFEENNFDVVYNLAGFANLDKAIHFPKEAFELNVIGNINILDACKKNNIKQFVFASSAYAMSDKGSFYGISKLTSEKIIEEYKLRYNLDYTILRFGSIYSERNFENNYIYQLIEKSITTNQINHEGDGEEIREYIHAVDAAKLSADVIKNKDFLGKHLMLSGVERMKRIELFNIINEISGGDIEINLHDNGYKNHYKFTPYSFTPENSQKLIPNPYIDIGQGILNCIRAINIAENE